MKQTLTILLAIMIASIATGQTVFDNFDTTIDSNYNTRLLTLSGDSWIYPYQEHQIVAEGQAALRLEYNIESTADWGGAATLALQPPGVQTVWDFSGYESLSINFYNKVPASWVGRARLRINLYDASNVELTNVNVLQTEWWYSFHSVLDRSEGWYTITLPLKDVGDIADDGDGGTGFWLTGWGGIAGNGQLDLDKIAGIAIEVAIDGPLDREMIKGEFIFDNFVLNAIPTSVSVSEQLPNDFALEQNYPNPFNPSTQINFNVANRSNVKLTVFDILGREVATLVDKEMMPGKYNVVFDAGDLPAGIYFYKIQAGKYSQTNKMILLK